MILSPAELGHPKDKIKTGELARQSKVERKVVFDEALEEALDETSAIAEFDVLPISLSEISESCRYFDDADIGQEVRLASSCGKPSGFAAIGPTALVFVPSLVPPDTETDDEHPGLHESSESECGVNCDYLDSESSD